jgi:nicotinamidase-related amidase
MTTTYDPKITALLCIDFYNDFLSEGGKLWP